MGDQKINTIADKKARSKFIRHLLNDIKAIELMLEKGLFESDITRIGSEQEFCLVTKHWRPSKKSAEILGQAVEESRVGENEKLKAIKRLKNFLG